MKKFLTKENFIYFFILLSPFLDIISSVFSFGKYSISTFIRPIIPLILLIIIFFQDKKVRLPLIISTLIYLGYFIIHLFIYQDILTKISFGNTLYEASYLCNYTYLVFLLFVFIYLSKKESLKNLNKVILIYSIIYIGSIFISIITNTSYETYPDSFGYRGWFNTGGAVSCILLCLLFILIVEFIKKQSKKEKIVKGIIILLIVFYLMFLIGTRTGLFGSLLILAISRIFQIFLPVIRKEKYNKSLITSASFLFTGMIILVLIFGSYTIERRKELDNLAGIDPDNPTSDTIYMPTDVIDIVDGIKNNFLEENFLSKEQENALLKLDEYTKKEKIKSTDYRMQQLIYHSFLYLEQDDIYLKFFGNGFLANMGVLTLEMEFFAFLYNFGIIGIILFLVPFLSIFIYSIVVLIKNFKRIDFAYLMYLSACFMIYAISFLAGHTFFNTSVMLIIVIIHTKLFLKSKEIKGDKS